MKILIVDDIYDNREMLERLIGRYSSKYQLSCQVLHAQNGQEAVDICKQERIDLIFMDIIMPIMDGLEATTLIKDISPSPMIIVISSENDEVVKGKILKAGAEDYILKPFSSAIMLSRLNNYQKLIASRHSIGFQSKAINVFTGSVYSYHTQFFISNEDELAQFWETMLVRLEYQKYIAQLSDFVRLLYYLGSFQLQKSYKCHIFLEEDADNFYFSMDNMKLLSKDLVERSIKKYYDFADYKIKDDIISFALSRTETKESIAFETAVEASKKLIPAQQKEEVQLRTFDILDADALSEFEHYVAKLQTEISLMGSSSLEIDDIDTMNEYIKQIAAILSVSQDAYEISESLRRFSTLLDEYSEPFLAMSKELSHMMSSFIRDIITWKEMIFYKGAPSVDFLNNSISSSIEMIRAVFVQDAEDQGDVDDIFDF